MKLLRAFSKEWLASVTVALLVHFFIFFGSGFAFVQAPQYGIEASSGGIEVSLIAALPATAEKAMSEAKDEQEPVQEDGEEIFQEKQKREQKLSSKNADLPKKDYTFENTTEFTGDGSSAVPGQSPTTFYTPGGGSTDDKAGFLKNPPPAYPREAVQKGQEGLVLLHVSVDSGGRVEKVEIKKSSGYRVLDDSARKTIKRWKFDPARLGMMNVSAQIEIPIRFILEEELKRLRQ
jgi:protein TonB